MAAQDGLSRTRCCFADSLRTLCRKPPEVNQYMPHPGASALAPRPCMTEECLPLEILVELISKLDLYVTQYASEDSASLFVNIAHSGSSYRVRHRLESKRPGMSDARPGFQTCRGVHDVVEIALADPINRIYVSAPYLRVT